MLRFLQRKEPSQGSRCSDCTPSHSLTADSCLTCRWQIFLLPSMTLHTHHLGMAWHLYLRAAPNLSDQILSCPSSIQCCPSWRRESGKKKCSHCEVGNDSSNDFRDPNYKFSPATCGFFFTLVLGMTTMVSHDWWSNQRVKSRICS